MVSSVEVKRDILENRGTDTLWSGISGGAYFFERHCISDLFGGSTDDSPDSCLMDE